MMFISVFCGFYNDTDYTNLNGPWSQSVWISEGLLYSRSLCKTIAVTLSLPIRVKQQLRNLTSYIAHVCR